MYEEAKLAEANYFYSMMVENYNDRQKFDYNLSAFLTSARSVMQYILEEAQSMEGGRSWYDRQISTRRILSFFKDKRDVNIHSEPAKPSINATVSVTETIRIKDTASIIVRDSEGNIKYQSPTRTNERKDKPQAKLKQSDINIRYLFSDWKEEEDLMTLCQIYLDELQIFVNDWKQRGFLTEE